MSTQVPSLLQINSSLYAANGQSSQLAQQLVAAWQAKNPNGVVVVRDLAADPLPHLTAERFQAFLTKPEERTTEQHAVAAQSDALIDELKNADTVVLGLPMYNFGIPSTLKAWFDHIARAGVSFRYTSTGPEGLVGDRKVYVVATRGGRYQGTALDTQTGHVSTFLAFLGIKDLEFVYAEGLASGEDSRRAALDTVHSVIDRIAA
ncbi:MAG: NAD(P)H-dependent oxidoreductase [Pseudomonadota bacterium]|nr:NAD(P)H-dependent oxidoreductase [Pseudomonadota bacterium]